LSPVLSVTCFFKRRPRWKFKSQFFHIFLSAGFCQPAFDALLGVVDEVLAVDSKTVERAKQIVLEYRRLSARDAIHLSIMERHGIERILSFDSGFDSFPGITRLS
jgi:predicted nucleic acid-binding protein